jgi:hypothetical protein
MYAIFLSILLAASLTGGGLLWSAHSKLADAELANTHLTNANAVMAANVRNLVTQRNLARDAAIVAQKERTRVAIQAVKYETIRDAFRKGNFDAPLPDDFKLLISCLLHRASGNPSNRTDCP